MSRKTFALAALLSAAVSSYAVAADLPIKATPKALTPAPFFFVNENSISYSYETKATDPGNGYTPKHVLTFTHFDVWAYGTNFFTVDWLKATSGATPANPCFLGSAATGCQPYTEIYGLFRSTFGFNQISGTKMFSMGPLTNVSLLIGADLNSDNTFFASAKRSIEAGLQFDFAMPYKGFFNVGIVAYKEWQHNGFQSAFNPFNPSGSMDFDTTWRVELLYVQPLGFLPPALPLTFKFLGGIQGPKGNGFVGPTPATTPAATTTEYRLNWTLALDVGQMVANKPGMLSVWTTYRYWKNKFGIDPAASGLGFTVENQFIFGTTIAF